MTEDIKPIKLDIGCGVNKKEGFTGIDSIAMEGVDIVLDVRQTPWPFEDNSVDEVNCSHFLEHLTGAERVSFFNELYRILKPKATALIITPAWSNERAYGDPTHQWPPVTSWTYLYLNKDWREGTPTQKPNAPHTGYTCDFDAVMVGTLDPNDQYIAFRSDEVKGTFMRYNINVNIDLIATITKKG
jgi:SAM-dependent methyltransferase